MLKFAITKYGIEAKFNATLVRNYINSFKGFFEYYLANPCLYTLRHKSSGTNPRTPDPRAPLREPKRSKWGICWNSRSSGFREEIARPEPVHQSNEGRWRWNGSIRIANILQRPQTVAWRDSLSDFVDVHIATGVRSPADVPRHHRQTARRNHKYWPALLC